MKIRALVLLLLATGGRAFALEDPNRVTLPTAASIVGLAPFFSDVRVFNTSYDATLTLEATYRCFVGVCPAQAPTLEFEVAPRATKAFNDMVGGAFAAPNSAGGLEFDVIEGGKTAEVGVTS